MMSYGFLLVDVLLAVAIGTAGITGMTVLLAQVRSDELALAQFRDARQRNTERMFEWLRVKDMYTPPIGGWKPGDAVSLLTPCIAVLSVHEEESAGVRSVQDTLAAVLVDEAESGRVGGDCGSVGLSGVSTRPERLSTFSLGSAVVAHGVDCIVRDGSVYAFVAATSTRVADPDLFVIDITDPSTPVLVATLDVGAGLFSLDARESVVFAGRDSESLQVVLLETSDIQHPLVAKQATLPLSTGSFPEARTVLAYNDTVYAGTYETAGPELHLFSSELHFQASVAVNHSMRAFVPLRSRVNEQTQQLLYVASSGNAEELLVFDVTDGTHPVQIASLDLAGTGNATALALVGSVLLVGRQQVAGQPTLDVVDVRDPQHPRVQSSTVSLVRSGSVVNGLLYSNHRVVFTTTDSTKSIWGCEYADGRVEHCQLAGGYPDVGRIDVCNGYVAIPTQHALTIFKME